MQQASQAWGCCSPQAVRRRSLLTLPYPSGVSLSLPLHLGCPAARDVIVLQAEHAALQLEAVKANAVLRCIGDASHAEAIVSAVPRTARAVTFMATTTVSYRAFNARHPQVPEFAVQGDGMPNTEQWASAVECMHMANPSSSHDKYAPHLRRSSHWEALQSRPSCLRSAAHRSASRMPSALMQL